MVFVIDFNLEGSGGEHIDSVQFRYIGWCTKPQGAVSYTGEIAWIDSMSEIR